MDRRILTLSFAFLLVSLGSSSAVLQAEPASPRTRAFLFTTKIRIPTLPDGAEKLRLWVPLPDASGHQEVTGLKIKSAVPFQMHKDPEYGNRYAYLEVTPRSAKAPLELELNFQVKRHEYQVPLADPSRAPSAQKASPAELTRFLQPDRLVPGDGLMAELAGQQTRGLERPLDKARAIYNYVVSTMRYDKTGEGWGRGDAIYACNVRKGNCTDFHALFIGLMRAAGIPARFEIGFPLPTDRSEGEVASYHCWAQFYLDGIGWVPVDASEAWKHPDRREYYFGAIDPDRILFSRGRDIRFNPAQQGEPLNYFVYPYAELDGKPFRGIEYKFAFRDLVRNDRSQELKSRKLGKQQNLLLVRTQGWKATDRRQP